MAQGNTEVKEGFWTDRVGAWASGLCAAHCAVCALAPALFAALGAGVLLSHEAEWALTLVAVSFGGAALFLGWREHRSTAVLGLIVLGMVALMASRGLEMGSEHHGHHEEHHAERHDEDASDEEHAEPEHAEAEHSEGEHGGEDPLHAVGAGVGVLGGLMLASGHLLNLRALRRTREDCCEPEVVADI